MGHKRNEKGGGGGGGGGGGRWLESTEHSLEEHWVIVEKVMICKDNCYRSLLWPITKPWFKLVRDSQLFLDWHYLFYITCCTYVIPYELNQGSQVSYFGLQTLLPWRLYANYRDKVIPFVSHMQMTLYTYGNQFHEIFNSATRSWSTWRTFNT